MGDFETIPKLVTQGDEGKYAALLMLLYRLGGWFILGVVALIALWIVWTSREQTTTQYVQELRDSRDGERTARMQAYEIINQNSEALQRSAMAQETAARAQQELVIEIRRTNDRKDTP